MDSGNIESFFTILNVEIVHSDFIVHWQLLQPTPMATRLELMLIRILKFNKCNKSNICNKYNTFYELKFLFKVFFLILSLNLKNCINNREFTQNPTDYLV